MTLSMTFTYPLSGYQGHVIFEVEYLKSLNYIMSYGLSSYSTLI